MKKKNRRWKKVSGKIVYQNPWIKIHEDKVLRPDGKVGMYGYLEKPVGVFVIAYDETKKSVFFIKQHRYPVNEVILEIPSGAANSKNYLAEAKRELLEETGIKAKKWKRLGGFFVAAGHESTKIEAFLAYNFDRNMLKTESQEGDEAINDIVEIRLKDLPSTITDGKIKCGITLASLNLFFQEIKSAKIN